MARHYLSTSDLKLLNDARQQVIVAQNVLQFAAAHIAQVYELGPNDDVEDNGTVKRGTDPALETEAEV